MPSCVDESYIGSIINAKLLNMNYNTISKHVDIVLLGSFNPAIFHPEWFIKNNIIAEWEYTQKDILFVPDVTRVSLPSERYLAVLPDQFSIRATMPSDFLGLRDIVTSTFTLLKETPINQMGLNYTAVFKLSKDDWVTFGKKLVPTEVWTNSAKYFSELDDKKKEQAGLLALTMHLPRPDELNGFILSRLRVKSFENYEIIFEINNHIEIENKDVSQMLKILESSWEKSLLFAETYIGNILNA
ncbi:MAG: hypothetical protein A6F72_06780 [Cycloclasticus sp. symbiont of Poecilosclerida sp. N]|nr:MAG: hypothetical protein A6F72_06780 [Cycloclasticus sp. symbiont of Poecilosclerida sp. N]